MYCYILGKGSIMQACKHLTRLGRGSQKREWLSFIGWRLTKPERSCKGLTDTSHLVYPYPSPQCLGGLGNSPVVVRFNRDFDGVGLKSL